MVVMEALVTFYESFHQIRLCSFPKMHVRPVLMRSQKTDRSGHGGASAQRVGLHVVHAYVARKRTIGSPLGVCQNGS
jgi:hypothetical protein